MIQIRPVTDFQNSFSEIESTISKGQPVYLTKDGYGAMVVLSMEKYAELSEDTDYIEAMLDEADREALSSNVRYTDDEVFSRLL